MKRLKFRQKIQQLEKRKGGYYFLKIESTTVDKFEKRRATRLRCNVNEKLEFSCGLNHLGDGNFYIILATRYLKSLDKKLGDLVSFKIYEDPNPLGVEIPEVVTAIINQDSQLKEIYDSLSDGKKRSLVFTIDKIKDIDKQISKVTKFLNDQIVTGKSNSRRKIE
jgi:hypothetical protein